MSITAAHDNHEKIDTLVSFSYTVIGLRLAGLRAVGAPLLKLNILRAEAPMLIIKISKETSPQRWRFYFALKRNET